MLYAFKFTDPQIREFLRYFYGPQGGVESQYLENAQFILDECRDCGLIYQRQIPGDFLMDKLYKVWIDPGKSLANDLKDRNAQYYIEFAREIMMLIGYFKTRPSELEFLDFGMGWGDWARLACAFGCSSYGSELCEEKSAYAGSFGVNSITRDEIKRHKFDFINIREVLEHIGQPQETLFYLKNSLKKGGLIKISLPCGQGIKRRLKVMDWKAPKGSRNSLNPVSPLEHINCFNRNTLLKMAKLSGLKPVKMPLRLQYAYKIDWGRPILPLLKSILKPLYDNFLNYKGTSIFFRNV
jgi:hypothetical protein